MRAAWLGAMEKLRGLRQSAVNEWKRDGANPTQKTQAAFRNGSESQPRHVDDSKERRRNIPWLHYVEACWDYAEPDTNQDGNRDWLVIISGHNVGPLFQAIESIY